LKEAQHPPFERICLSHPRWRCLFSTCIYIESDLGRLSEGSKELTPFWSDAPAWVGFVMGIDIAGLYSYVVNQTAQACSSLLRECQPHRTEMLINCLIYLRHLSFSTSSHYTFEGDADLLIARHACLGSCYMAFICHP
jgi:hypothetical protein